jgi:hypothetical protein
MGEHDRHSVVWDYIAVYPPGAVWEDHPPRRFITVNRWCEWRNQRVLRWARPWLENQYKSAEG